MTTDRLESFGIYKIARQLFDEFWDERCKHLLSAETITKRIAILDQIIGGLTNTLITIEKRKSGE